MGGTLPHPFVPHQSMDIKHEDPSEAVSNHDPTPAGFIPDSWQPRLTALARHIYYISKLIGNYSLKIPF